MNQNWHLNDRSDIGRRPCVSNILLSWTFSKDGRLPKKPSNQNGKDSFTTPKFCDTTLKTQHYILLKPPHHKVWWRIMNPALFVFFQGTRAKQRRFPGNNDQHFPPPRAVFCRTPRRASCQNYSQVRNFPSRYAVHIALWNALGILEVLIMQHGTHLVFFLKKSCRILKAQELRYHEKISFLFVNQPITTKVTKAPFSWGRQNPYHFPTKKLHIHLNLRPRRLRWLPCNFPRPRNLGKDATRSRGVRGLVEGWNMEGQKCLWWIGGFCKTKILNSWEYGVDLKSVVLSLVLKLP